MQNQTVSLGINRLAAGALAAALWALCLSGPAALGAPPPGLQPQAVDEISALLREKASWTPAQRKLDSALIHAAKKHRGQAFAPGAPHLRTGVKVQKDGRVLVDLKANVTPGLLALVQQGGGQVVNSFPHFKAIRAQVTLDQLEALAASPDVVTIRRASEALTRVGSVTSEGDVTHRAATARSAFWATGGGLRIGVLSDGVNYLSNSQASGDLGPVTVLWGQWGYYRDAEGTAMLEIIHDLAPDAQLYFATAFESEASFAQNILDLRSAGCDIILDDVGYFDEPPFQDGVIAQAANAVAADGALYFSAAGNSGNKDADTSGTWEGDFVDGGAVSFPESGHIHSFGPVTYNTLVSPGVSGYVQIFWADPAGASTNDYDLFILDTNGTAVVNSSTTVQDGFQSPYESCSYALAGERIVILKFSGEPRFLRLDTVRGRLSLNTPGATADHSAAKDVLGVAAVDSATAYPNPFTGGSANPVETFSSDGPRRMFFNPDGTPITPGNFSSTGGAVLQKPDIAAADGVVTSVPGFTDFHGTSAAAPHAAAIAALIWSANLDLTPAQIRAALTNTALDIGPAGADRDAGAGLVMAYEPVQSVVDALRITPGSGLAGSGTLGEPFSPVSQAYVLTNAGSGGLAWLAQSTEPWVSISPASGSLAPGATATVQVWLNAMVNSLALGGYNARITFCNAATGARLVRDTSLTMSGEKVRVYYFPLDTDPGWPRQGEWAFGKPAGLGGNPGYPDPTSGATGTNVFGYNLNGNYSSTPGGPYYLTAGPFNFSHYSGVQLQFQRWLNVDEGLYAEATIELSTNGTTWDQIWGNDPVWPEYAYRWTKVSNNLSPAADNSSHVYVRWGHNVLYDFAYSMSGWNLDDIEFVADPLPLSLAVPAAASEGQGTITGTVAVPWPPAADLSVSLASSDTNEVTVPATVTIPAGKTNATFALVIRDDTLRDGTQTAIISAWALHYIGTNASIAVFDNETATLAVTLPASATEGDRGISGTVSVSAPAGKTLAVQLSSSNTNEIQVPAVVLIPAGQTSAVFSVTVIDDRRFDGDQAVTVTAHVQNWTDGTAIITVHDNESSQLTLSLPAQAREGTGVLTNAGRVSVPGTLQTNLSVSLLSDDTSEVTVPPSVTILLGQTSTVFNVTIVDDAILDGPQTATLWASAAGFSDASCTVTVTDNETPLAPTNPSPTDFAGDVSVKTDLAWAAPPGDPGAVVTYDVYFGTNATPGPSELLGSTTNTTWDLPTLAPLTTYYWQVVARRLGLTAGPVWQFTTRGVHHLEWSAIASPQYRDEAFTATLTAKDEWGTTVTNFTGPVSLAAFGGAVVQFAEDFEDGDYAGWNNEDPGAGFVGAVTNDTAASGVYSFTMIGGNYTYFSGISHPLPDLTPGWVQFYVRASSSDRDGCGVALGTSPSWDATAVIFYAMDDGTMGVEDYTYGWLGVRYAAGQWYKIGLKFDWVGRTFDYYVDDTLVAAGISFLAGTVDHLSGIYLFNLDDTQSWWDEIRFYETGPPAAVSITPTNTGNFVDGVWTGQITAQQRATNVYLVASDGAGHLRASSTFDVLVRNDLLMTMTASAAQVNAGSNLTYAISLYNEGPDTATGVVLGNILSAPATLVAVTPAFPCAKYGDTIVCDLGSLEPGASLNLSLVITPGQGGYLTNAASVSRGEFDADPINNHATAVTLVLPWLTISDVAVPEGNSGTTPAGFNVTLTPPSSETVTVNYATTSGTATAGSDYLATNGTLVFNPGDTNKTIAVQVFSDTTYESNETFCVSLSAAANALVANSQATGTILNDDPLLAPIPDQTITEGSLLTFTATHNGPVALTSTLITDFEVFADGMANGTVLFRDPLFSSSTVAFLDSTPDVSSVTGSFPPGHSGSRVLHVSWSFVSDAGVNPWLRLTTYNPGYILNPTVAFNQGLRFDIYADRDLLVGVGLRETSTGAPIGASGGTSGTIEFVGATRNGSTPVPVRTVTAGSWTNLQFYFPSEVISAFTGNGVLESSTGKGVLEHLTLAPAAGRGTYNIYLDNFVVVSNLSTYTFSLAPGAPAGAGINPTTGVFTWTPTEAQGPGVYAITVCLTNNASPPLSDQRTFTVTVNEVNSAPTLAAIPNRTIDEGTTLTFTNAATDPDLPANPLAFSLGAAAPSGSAIDPLTGVFTWTPTEAQGPSTNLITIIVTDDGSPRLIDSKSFTVVVNEVNSPPALAPIATRTVHACTTLFITSAATDPDIPANRLTFSLPVGQASGATIAPASGLFTWTPTDLQVGSNYFIVSVTDDGSPPLSDSRGFGVVVVSRPVIEAIGVTNSTAWLLWSAVPAQGYQLQYCDALCGTNWVDVSAPVTATGPTAMQFDSSTLQTQRFYRIKLLP